MSNYKFRHLYLYPYSCCASNLVMSGSYINVYLHYIVLHLIFRTAVGVATVVLVTSSSNSRPGRARATKAATGTHTARASRGHGATRELAARQAAGGPPAQRPLVGALSRTGLSRLLDTSNPLGDRSVPSMQTNDLLSFGTDWPVL